MGLASDGVSTRPPPPPRRTTPIAAETVRDIALDAGFDLVAFGPADPGEHGAHFLRWLEAGRHGEMQYLEANRERMLQPTIWRPGVRSAIALAVDYGGPAVELPGGGRVARYAGGRDYHRWLRERVFSLRQRLEAEGVPYGSMNGGTDAVPILERALAVRAGIGFLAKSAMVISPTHGPYLQLAELLTGLELPPDPPSAGSCGTCTACLDACPTGAITAPFEVDARRCLSYTTIELRGTVPVELRRAQGDWLFGCDICLEVCPFTRRSGLRERLGDERPAELRPHRIVQTWTLVDVLELSPERYQGEFTGTAMRRATRNGLRRNAAVVLGNRRDESALPALVKALGDEDTAVRSHAAWAIGCIDARHPSLANARERETDVAVRREIEQAMAPG
jgi:epoxyqueuosine reductase